MGMFGDNFADRAAAICFAAYKSLSKKGKPQEGREWTKMACFLKTSTLDSQIQVISLATGTKCIGQNLRDKCGAVLNDSHAEILARRLFLKYLCHEMALFYTENNTSVFSRKNNLLELNEDIHVHLFTTDIPCGDACIYPQEQTDIMTDTKEPPIKKRKIETVETNKIMDDLLNQTSNQTLNIPKNTNKASINTHIECKCDNSSDKNIDCSIPTNCERLKSTNNCKMRKKIANKNLTSACEELRSKNFYDIRRTGAKCVKASALQDPHLPGTRYHCTGALRLKPGRGDRTLSMSCSDKIMKWCVLGLQGGLLSNFLGRNIYLSSVITSDEDFNRAAMERAFSLRGRAGSMISTPQVLHATQERFKHRKQSMVCQQGSEKVSACGSAIIWCPPLKIHGISSNGRKHGITKKCIGTLKARTVICKAALFGDFKKLLVKSNFVSSSDGKSYYENKHSCERYERARTEFFRVFHEWQAKPTQLEQFL